MRLVHPSSGQWNGRVIATLGALKLVCDQSWRLTNVWRQAAADENGDRSAPVIYERFLHNPGWGSRLDAPLKSQVNNNLDPLRVKLGYGGPISPHMFPGPDGLTDFQKWGRRGGRPKSK